jgi:F-type H+-transporting ATPase subunit b
MDGYTDAILTAGKEAVPFHQDPTFWAFVGLVLFIGVLLWRNVPGMLVKSLDDRAAKIQSELANAETLRKEAEAKLKDAERRQAEAEAQAVQIVDAARKEAAQLAEASAKSLAEAVARRQKTAEERIARAESEAIRDVRLAAVDTASRAAAAVLSETITAKAADDQFALGLEAVKKALS